jgi:tRNA threonylcarbamoyladenosine modification (KEOPS) complex  Pcc1 subunit
MTAPAVWEGRLTVVCPDAGAADRLYRVLLPESAREVPRARAGLEPPTGRELALRIEARDTGALRAAVQTFLGWVQLAEATEARSAGPSAE